MQFLALTWDRYGVDGDEDGRRDIYDPSDAIPAAARYLQALGAPESWTTALTRYGYSHEFARTVTAAAASIRRRLARPVK